ncbi:MAG: alpha/beta hydrolase family protein [Armatimonadota bacterium]
MKSQLLFLLSIAICAADGSPEAGPLSGLAQDAAAMSSAAKVENSSASSDEITGANLDVDQLWGMTEIRKSPLDIEVVSSKSEDGYIVEELYFTSEVTPNGPNRIFCAFARPEKPKQPVPLLLQVHGGGGHCNADNALWSARQMECAVLDLDWSGEFIPGAKRYTIWRNDPPNPYAGHFAIERGVRGSSVYHIIIACRRALDYACSLPGVDDTRIGAMGGSWGGFLSTLLAGVDPRVNCVACAFGGGNVSRTRGFLATQMQPLSKNKQDEWLRAFDPVNYISRTKASIILIASANDSFFWLEDLQGYYARLRGDKNLMIVPNSNHNVGGPRLADMLWVRWMRQHFYGAGELPRVTDIKCSGRTYTWKTRGGPATRAVLYWSPGEASWPARYWLEMPASRQGDLWRVDLPKNLAGFSGMVYAAVFDSDNGAAASAVISRKGTNPSTGKRKLWSDERLWDEERGATAWRPMAKTSVPGSLSFNLESGSDGRISVGPVAGEKNFAVMTNSVILASGYARRHKGIRIVLDGCGQAGTITVALHRNWMSRDETAYSASVDYGEGRSTIDLLWDVFKGQAASLPDYYPFDTLTLGGSRSDGSIMRIESIRFY